MAKILPMKTFISLATAFAMVLLSCASFLGGAVLTRNALSDASTVQSGGLSLFRASGNYSVILSAQLEELAANTSRTNKGTYLVSDASQIRTANGGEIPSVKLFETLSGVTVADFTSKTWKLVYITYPQGSGDPVFTFMMDDPYVGASFDESSQAYVTYTNNTVRTELNDDFSNVLSKFPASLTERIVTPNNITGAWQTSQSSSGYASTGNALTGAALNDLVWLPSYVEVETGGIWNLNSTERGYTIDIDEESSAPSWDRSWLRSGAVSSVYQATSVSNNGELDSSVTSPEFGLRPAIHLDLSGLGLSVNYPESDGIDRHELYHMKELIYMILPKSSEDAGWWNISKAWTVYNVDNFSPEYEEELRALYWEMEGVFMSEAATQDQINDLVEQAYSKLQLSREFFEEQVDDILKIMSGSDLYDPSNWQPYLDVLAEIDYFNECIYGGHEPSDKCVAIHDVNGYLAQIEELKGETLTQLKAEISALESELAYIQALYKSTQVEIALLTMELSASELTASQLIGYINQFETMLGLAKSTIDDYRPVYSGGLASLNSLVEMLDELDITGGVIADTIDGISDKVTYLQDAPADAVQAYSLLQSDLASLKVAALTVSGNTLVSGTSLSAGVVALSANINTVLDTYADAIDTNELVDNIDYVTSSRRVLSAAASMQEQALLDLYDSILSLENLADDQLTINNSGAVGTFFMYVGLVFIVNVLLAGMPVVLYLNVRKREREKIV